MVVLMVISTWIPCEFTHWYTHCSKNGTLIWNPYDYYMNPPIWFYDGNFNMDTMRIYPLICTRFQEWLNSSETHMTRIWTHPYGFMMVISTWIPCKFTHWFTHCSKNGYTHETHMTTIWTHPYGFYEGNFNMDTMWISPLICTQFQEWLNSSETHMTRIWTHPYGFIMAISIWMWCEFTHWFTHGP